MSKIQPIHDEDFFYNHGDNPAFKKFMKIAQANNHGKHIIQRRTYVIDRGVRFFMARNWDDFLQRDIKALTFPRAFAVFVLNSMALLTVSSWVRRLLPVGRFGIRSVFQTSFYHNFGPLGLAGAGGLMFAAAYTWWKTLRFTVFKFYRHVIMGDRNWFFEQYKQSRYSQYKFSDDPLSKEEKFKSLYRKTMSAKPTPVPTFGGPYMKQPETEN